MNELIRLIRTRPGFRWLWLGEMVSMLGDWLSYVAVSLLAIEKGGGEGALALALVLAAHSLPHAFLAPISGVFADRFDRRRLLLGTHILQVFLTLGMAWFAYVESLAAIQLMLVLRTSVSALEYPVRTAAVQALVERDDLMRANALTSATWSVMYAVGMGLGGLLTYYGPVRALLIDAATFAVAAGFIVLVPAIPPVASAAESVLAGWWRTLKVVWQQPDLLRATFAKTPLSLAAGGSLVSLNLTVAQMTFMGTAGLTLGVLQMIRGVGTGVGPIVASRAATPKNLGAVWNVAIIAALVGMLAFTVPLPTWAVVLGTSVWGLGTGANWVLSQTELQRRAPADLVGKASALDALALTLGMSSAALVGGVVVEWTGHIGYATWPGWIAGLVMAVGLSILGRSGRTRGLGEAAHDPAALGSRL